MTQKALQKKLVRYKKTSQESVARKRYFNNFLKKMLYRTTKTENPETTMQMVSQVLKK